MPKVDLGIDSKLTSLLSSSGVSSSTLSLALKNDLSYSLELWHSQGLKVTREHNNYFFSTKFTPIEDETFCIVDIETNGSSYEKHQIIEIAAIKVRGDKIIDEFNSLVFANEINPIISKLTGITLELTKDAPNLKSVLYGFREFLSDSIFVAHNTKFDFNFISASFDKVGLSTMLNRSICTLDLSQRVIESYRYALSYLNRLFLLHPEASHHRAMCDVKTTYELFKMLLKKVDSSIRTTEDLINFSKSAKMLKRPKYDTSLVAYRNLDNV